MGRKYQVLLVDEEGLLRESLCARINLEEDYQVLGAVTDATALEALCLPLSPDIVILDFGVLGLSGTEAVKAIRQRWPATRILVLTFRREDEIIEAALRAGVDGYLLKTDSGAEFVTALASIVEHKRYISPSIFDRVVSGYVRKHSRAQLRNSDGLSDRERAVMRRIAQGYRTREIAEQLSLSYKTIEKHRSTLMRKLGLRTATAVAAYAIANGYLEVKAD
jgi:DNA-binding NarL/FixJ family response regulator